MVKKRPTLKTIAQITGFAVPTVSRALSDAPDIGRPQSGVLKVAQDIGYVPNHEGLRLRTGKTMNIALVLAIVDKVTDHSGLLIAAVARALRGSGYTLSITPYSPEDDPVAAVRQIVETKQADAIIIEQIKTDDLRVRYMSEEGFPFAMFGRTEVPGNFHTDFDNRAFGLRQPRHSCNEVASEWWSYCHLWIKPMPATSSRGFIRSRTNSASTLKSWAVCIV